MDTADKIKSFMEKLQALPEPRKKIILWAIVVIIALPMGYFWVKGFMNTVKKIGGSVQEVKFPQIDTSSMPKIDLQNIQNELKK